MLICAAAAPRPKGIGKKWQLKYNTYIHIIIFSTCPRITHAHAYACTHKKKKVKMVTGEGTWTKGPFVKKTFLSFVLRTAAAAATIPPSSPSWHVAYRRRKHLQKGARGRHQMSCETFRTKLYFCNSLTAAQDSWTGKKKKKQLLHLIRIKTAVESNTPRIRNAAMTTKVSLSRWRLFIPSKVVFWKFETIPLTSPNPFTARRYANV